MALTMRKQDHIPVKCTNPDCGFEFKAFNFINSVKSQVTATNNSTSCPKCFSKAMYADFKIDRQGNIYIKDFFDDVRKINNVEKLSSIKTNLEAANDDLTADDLIDSLIGVEPNFNQYKEYFKSLPLPVVAFFITTLIALIGMLIAYQANEISDESNDIARQQLELSRGKFEYEKVKDNKKVQEIQATEAELKERNNQLEQIRKEFEKQIKEIENYNKPPKLRPLLKASLRNKPCECGSGKKGKKCHPRGLA
jgi:hypothetical protein